MEHDKDAVKTGRGISRRSFLLGCSTVLGGGVLGDALYREPRDFEVREIAIPAGKVPPGRELRLVHLSDLHIRVFHDYYREVAGAVNALAPEVILLTGDYLEQGRRIGEVRRFLQLLRASQGIFAIQGNWDYRAGVEGENMRRHFARAGATLLINERYDLDLQGIPVSILGLDYPSSGNYLRRLQQGADAGRLNLLLSHVPAFPHDLLEGMIDLILCGHTHGGQVRFPFIPPFYLPRFSGSFVDGLYRVGNSDIPLYVTRGVGTSIFPIRFLCRPEITFLRLVAA